MKAKFSKFIFCFIQCLAKKTRFFLFMKLSKGCSRGHKLSLKFCYDLEYLDFLAPNIYESDFSNEVLWSLADQRTAKSQALKA